MSEDNLKKAREIAAKRNASNIKKNSQKKRGALVRCTLLVINQAYYKGHLYQQGDKIENWVGHTNLDGSLPRWAHLEGELEYLDSDGQVISADDLEITEEKGEGFSLTNENTLTTPVIKKVTKKAASEKAPAKKKGAAKKDAEKESSDEPGSAQKFI